MIYNMFNQILEIWELDFGRMLGDNQLSWIRAEIGHSDSAPEWWVAVSHQSLLCICRRLVYFSMIGRPVWEVADGESRGESRECYPMHEAAEAFFHVSMQKQKVRPDKYNTDSWKNLPTLTRKAIVWHCSNQVLPNSPSFGVSVLLFCQDVRWKSPVIHKICRSSSEAHRVVSHVILSDLSVASKQPSPTGSVGDILESFFKSTNCARPANPVLVEQWAWNPRGCRWCYTAG